MLPKQLQSIIDQAYTMCNALDLHHQDCLSIALAVSEGAGVLANCTFFLGELTRRDMHLSIEPDRDGTFTISVKMGRSPFA